MSTIRRLSALCAISVCALLAAGAVTASAAAPTLVNDPPGAVTVASVTANGTLATDSTLSDCHFEYVEPRALGGGAKFIDPSVSPFSNPATASVGCASSDGAPIAGPGDVPADSASHALSAEIPLSSPGATVYYRLVAENADGIALATGWEASGFGIAAFDSSLADASGDALTQAGAHPTTYATAFDFNAVSRPGRPPITVEDNRELIADLPAGFLGSTAGLPQCTTSDLANGISPSDTRPQCPSASQVGTLAVRVDVGETAPDPVFNMVPPPNAPARFGINVAGAIVILDTTAIPGGGGYRLRTVTSVPQALAINGNTLTLWGVPAAPSHDAERACPGESIPGLGGPTNPKDCGTRAPIRAAFRTPTSCTAPGQGLRFDLRANSWQHPDVYGGASILTHQAPGYPEPPASWGTTVGIEGCDQVPFEPTLDAQPTTNRADSPTGLNVDLGLPADCWAPKLSAEDVEASICQSDMKQAQVTLPQGLSLNPAAAAGRQACTPAQAGVTSALGSAPVEFDEAPATCPDASKLGTVEIRTPLLDKPLTGSVYLAQQSQNPFHSLLAMYLVAELPGLRIKQAGEVSLSPSGQLTTSFASVPQTAFSNIHLELYGGQRAVLRTPPTCGIKATRSTFIGWANPDRPLHTVSHFEITEGAGGSPCPEGERERPFDPKLSAGTQNPLAGSYSPFSLRLTREDGSQEITRLDATLAPGLIGAPKGIAYCPDSVLASFGAEPVLGTGAAQEASPSCPAASRIGTLTVGAGAGANPFYTSSGRAYLAGPYHGAPLSVAVLAPAVAGPFDLGTVLVRNAVHVDPESAQISVASDPFPLAVHGIPLDLRDVRVALNRPNFTLNPTSCEPAAITSLVTSALGATASPSSHFQAASCDRLGFKPKLALKLKGGTKRSNHPALTAVLTARKGDANIGRVQVALPHSEFLAQSHIKTICTRVQFAAGSGGGAQCPRGSVYGQVTATSPLVDYPLSGKVYLRSSSHPLPDMVLALHGPATQPLEVDAVGRIDSVNGGIRTTFATVPDAPLTKVLLRLPGGKKSLLENSTNLCRSTNRASVAMEAHNAKLADSTPALQVKCPQAGRSGKARKAHHG